MKINTYLIQLACMILLIFGGTFILRYFRTEELLLDQIIGVVVGFLLLIFSLFWRIKKNKASRTGA
ncbi:hypothetical protein MHH33_11135 [Paenisporosarcina sp. FSL H8-0542]|uniref:hypothetical protein n=1 Tax=unclassified Paenisporosarcina TaxID=2642018 RepID=UPI00034EA913|nr:hypothetical protein [Paenisporosarcina sp. HGH0030]EPD53303.1 hypothetical protein HMPREF1210_01034 [Paenisporosarcina sp. HGH0030]